MTPLLSPAQIASMRSTVDVTALLHLATIERATGGAADDYGQPGADSWTVIASGVPAFYSPGRTSTPGEVVGSVVTHVTHEARVVLPANTDVQEADRITVTDEDGDVYGPLDVDRVRPGITRMQALVDQVTA